MPAVDQRLEHRARLAPEDPPLRAPLVRPVDEARDVACSRRRGRASTLEEHPVRDPEARHERLGPRASRGARTSPGPSGRSPCSGGFLRTMRFSFTGSLPAFASSRRFSMTCSGACATHAAAVVEALAPGAPGDLLEVAHAEDGRLLAVVLAELREEHRADGDVHADAERVGPADDREQALLRELLDEEAVLGRAARRGGGRCRARGSAAAPCRRACRSARPWPSSSPMARLRSFGRKSMLIRSCAVSAAARCVKLTT